MLYARPLLPVTSSAQEPVLARLSLLDRLLPVWILLAMASGLLLGRLLPGLQALLGTVQVGHTSLPIALGLLMMLYPVLAKVRYGGTCSSCPRPSPAGVGAWLGLGLGPLLDVLPGLVIFA